MLVPPPSVHTESSIATKGNSIYSISSILPNFMYNVVQNECINPATKNEMRY